MARLIGSMLFHVGAYDPASYAAVMALLVVAALTAAVIPARKAMKVEPVEALRYE
jgi:ABC-type lipoprotein release transport system permease subunit